MTLGKIIIQAMLDYGYNELDVLRQTTLSGDIHTKLLLDDIYPNNIPIRLLQKLLEFLKIPFDVAQAGIIATYEVMEQKKRTGEYKSYRYWTGLWENPEALWENPEALKKYITRLSELMNEVPRRCRLDLYCPAELAIYNAMLEVEKMPANTRLTEAVILLTKAKDIVADFIDGKS